MNESPVDPVTTPGQEPAPVVPKIDQAAPPPPPQETPAQALQNAAQRAAQAMEVARRQVLSDGFQAIQRACETMGVTIIAKPVMRANGTIGAEWGVALAE
jgi:hypothetical protein